MAQLTKFVFDAFLGFPRDSKDQTTFCELCIQILADLASMCGIMWQIEPVSYVFHQPT